jgi:hypothetical protein
VWASLPMPARQHTQHVARGILVQTDATCREVVIGQPAQPHHLPMPQVGVRSCGGRETVGSVLVVPLENAPK